MLINLDEHVKELVEKQIRENLKVRVDVYESYDSNDKNICVSVELIFNDKVISEDRDYHVL